MLDGILFEKNGVPSASIVTDVFQATGFQLDTSRTDAVVGPCPPPSAALLDLYVQRALEGER